MPFQARVVFHILAECVHKWNISQIQMRSYTCEKYSCMTFSVLLLRDLRKIFILIDRIIQNSGACMGYTLCVYINAMFYSEFSCPIREAV